MKRSPARRALALAMMTTGMLAACSPEGSKASREAGPDAYREAAAAPYKVRSKFSQDLHDALPERFRQAKEITVVGDANPPWRIVGSGGTVSGLQADVLSEFSTIFGVPFTSKIAAGIPAVKLGVQSGRYDLLFGPLTSSPDSRKDLNWIEYTIGIGGFLSAKSTPSISSPIGLCGHRVAYMSGSVGAPNNIRIYNDNCKKAGLGPIEATGLTDFNAILLSVKSGRADFAMSSAHQTSYVQSQNQDTLNKYIVGQDEAARLNLNRNQLGMAAAPKNEDLAKAVYGAWKVVFENGAYQDLMRKYKMEETIIDKPTLRVGAVQK